LCEENLYDVNLLITAINFIYPDTIIYLWTGYTYEELLEREKNEPLLGSILEQVDTLIDGRYEQDKRDTTLPLRGSSNQRIINLGAMRNAK